LSTSTRRSDPDPGSAPAATPGPAPGRQTARWPTHPAAQAVAPDTPARRPGPVETDSSPESAAAEPGAAEYRPDRQRPQGARSYRAPAIVQRPGNCEEPVPVPAPRRLRTRPSPAR